MLDPASRVHKPNNRKEAFFDAFEGQPTYAQRFRRSHNALPNLTRRPFVRIYFPQELWATMGVADGADAEQGKKKLALSNRTRLDKWMRNADDEGEEDEDKADDDEDEPDKEAEEGEDADPDQFDEEDEDENDDYNAEQYFSGGEDDDFGDDGGGGGGDDDY